MSIRVTVGTMLFGWINSARHKAYACLVIEAEDCESVEVCCQRPALMGFSVIFSSESVTLIGYTKGFLMMS